MSIVSGSLCKCPLSIPGDDGLCSTCRRPQRVPAMGFVTKDSGRRQEFPTGSVRDVREGKGRFDLIPPRSLLRIAQLYERGALKYGDRNWEKGQFLMRYIDSAMRHLNCLLAGENTEDHMAAVAWNAFSYIHTLAEVEAGRLPKELDDRPESMK